MNGSKATKLLRIFIAVYLVASGVSTFMIIIYMARNGKVMPPISAPMILMVSVLTLVLLPLTFSIRRHARLEGRKTLAAVMLVVRIFFIYVLAVLAFSLVVALLSGSLP